VITNVNEFLDSHGIITLLLSLVLSDLFNESKKM